MIWKHGTDYLSAFGRTIAVSDNFYAIMTETPGIHVIMSTNEDGSDGVPYKPQSFPVGIWDIRAPLARTSIYTAPYFIPTDAHQWVDEWELDEHQLYKCPTGRQVMDWGYGIHHSAINYTFGCLRVVDEVDLLWLVSQINLASSQVRFEVSA